jgi:hypothetical protein
VLSLLERRAHRPKGWSRSFDRANVSEELWLAEASRSTGRSCCGAKLIDVASTARTIAELVEAVSGIPDGWCGRRKT